MKYTIFAITRKTSEDVFATVQSTEFKVLTLDGMSYDIDEHSMPGHVNNDDILEYVKEEYYVEEDTEEVVVDEYITSIELVVNRSEQKAKWDTDDSPYMNERYAEVQSQLEQRSEELLSEMRKRVNPGAAHGFGCLGNGEVHPATSSFGQVDDNFDDVDLDAR